MNILIIIIAAIAYFGVAMAFYFGFALCDEIGEPGVNACCAIAWPLVLAICIIIGPFYSFWVFASWIHSNIGEEE